MSYQILVKGPRGSVVHRKPAGSWRDRAVETYRSEKSLYPANHTLLLLDGTDVMFESKGSKDA
jgi:hypothetical protein